MDRDAAHKDVSHEADERQRHLARQFDPHGLPVGLEPGMLIPCIVLPTDHLVARRRALVRDASWIDRVRVEDVDARRT
jgi:hypothetical protein